VTLPSSAVFIDVSLVATDGNSNVHPLGYRDSNAGVLFDDARFEYQTGLVETDIAGGSVENAERLDGLDSTQFARSDVAQTIQGGFTVQKGGHGIEIGNGSAITAYEAGNYVTPSLSYSQGGWDIGDNEILTTADEGSLDAGTLDNIDSSQFLRSDVNDRTSGALEVKPDTYGLRFGLDSDSSSEPTITPIIGSFLDGSKEIFFDTGSEQWEINGSPTADGSTILTTADEGTLDAGTLDNIDGSQFLRSDQTDTYSRLRDSDGGERLEMFKDGGYFADYVEAHVFRHVDNDGTGAREGGFVFEGSNTDGTDRDEWLVLGDPSSKGFEYDGNRVLTTADEGSLDAGTVDNIDSGQIARTDVQETLNEEIEFSARSGLDGSLGNSSGEVWRAGGPSSDFVVGVQGGFGRAALTWNARYDNSDSTWRYITDNEGASGIRIHNGNLDFYTADGSSSPGDPINFETATINNGSIDEADHAADADTLGGAGSAGLRSGLDANNNPIVDVSVYRYDTSKSGGAHHFQREPVSDETPLTLKGRKLGLQETNPSSPVSVGATTNFQGNDLKMDDGKIYGVESLHLNPDDHQEIEFHASAGRFELQETDSGTTPLTIYDEKLMQWQAGNNPSEGGNLFSVRSAGGADRLVVEHNQAVETENQVLLVGKGIAGKGPRIIFGTGSAQLRHDGDGLVAYDDYNNTNKLV
jgi:hypothetical protein